jgi:hypothetical protein
MGTSRQPLRHARITGAGTLMTAMLASCTTTIVEPYYRPESAQIEQSYLRPGADFGKYTKILPTPLEIYYPDNVPRPSDEDLNRLRSTSETRSSRRSATTIASRMWRRRTHYEFVRRSSI